MRRTLAWLLLLPFAAVSVLVGHMLAYRITSTPTGEFHAYLAHAPQVALILATLALLGLATEARARRRSPLPLALLAIVAFVAQEHLERLVHTGQMPLLLTSPVLWVGIALQLPLAIAVWWVARGLADDLAAPVHRGAPGVTWLRVPPIVVVSRLAAATSLTAHPGRGPPVVS